MSACPSVPATRRTADAYAACGCPRCVAALVPVLEPIAGTLTSRFRNLWDLPGLAREDLQQEALAAMCSSVETWRPGRGQRFTSWAYGVARQRILNVRQQALAEGRFSMAGAPLSLAAPLSSQAVDSATLGDRIVSTHGDADPLQWATARERARTFRAAMTEPQRLAVERRLLGAPDPARDRATLECLRQKLVLRGVLGGGELRSPGRGLTVAT